MTKSKIITYVAVAVLILLGFYWAYRLINKTSEPEMGGVVKVSEAGRNVSSIDNQADQLIIVLSDIDKIDLKNLLILNNEIFTTLQDFGKTIDDRVTGRTNPFAPFVGGEGAGIVKKGTLVSDPTLTIGSTTDEQNLDGTLLE